MAGLFGADLYRADLTRADLSLADLSGANLNWANLNQANLSEANLSKANLGNAYLPGAIFSRADLENTDFSGALVAYSTFGDVNLREVQGLEEVIHGGPSTIGIDTIYRSKGKIPKAFLREAGVPNTFIIYAASLTDEAFQYYSCFISYSHKDEEFAQRLYTDLQQKGVRCWYAPKHMKIGDKIRPTIDQSIRVHDKLLLVLSEHSMASQWVEQEVETALARDREQGETVLFPVRLDDAVMKIESGWQALIRNTRHIGDFSRWKDHDAYQQAFERLLRDLKAEV
jgi:hypothetical protein